MPSLFASTQKPKTGWPPSFFSWPKIKAGPIVAQFERAIAQITDRKETINLSQRAEGTGLGRETPRWGKSDRRNRERTQRLTEGAMSLSLYRKYILAKIGERSMRWKLKLKFFALQVTDRRQLQHWTARPVLLSPCRTLTSFF